MLQILMLLAGLVCLFKNEISINKEKSVRGTPIKILGVILIACASSLSFMMYRGDGMKSDQWLIYAILAVPVIYLIYIIIFCGKPIENKDVTE